MTAYVGTSGWQYDSWKGRFYPDDLAKLRWLEHYAARFRTVEINNTFYRLPGPQTFAAWYKRTPVDFVIVPKLSRYLTHIKRLKDCEEPVKRFLASAKPLRNKLGPLLMQLPPNLQADPGRLAHALDAFPAGMRIAFEPRHDSWFSDDVRSILTARNHALCLTDRLGKPQGPLWRTADWTYVRFHVGSGSPHPCYTRGDLAKWVERLASDFAGIDSYVYFNNDPLCCAVRDAVVFAELAAEAGLAPTKVPSRDEVSVR